MRQNYIVAAATETGKTSVYRTQLSAIGPDDLEKCQRIANNGPELQQFFEAVGSGNLEKFTSQLNRDSPFFTEQNDRLIYICIYLDLLRKYIVDEEIVRNYENAADSTPFSAETSHGILKMLSARLEPERASEIFDRDLEKFTEKSASVLVAANFFRAGAMAKSEAGNMQDAEIIMLRAVKKQNSEDKWRRLAEFASARGKDKKAIEYYNTAHALSPLPPASALMMAKLLMKIAATDQIQPFLDIVSEAFPAAADTIRKKIAGT